VNWEQIVPKEFIPVEQLQDENDLHLLAPRSRQVKSYAETPDVTAELGVDTGERGRVAKSKLVSRESKQAVGFIKQFGSVDRAVAEMEKVFVCFPPASFFSQYLVFFLFSL
jgi:hypothetical protein